MKITIVGSGYVGTSLATLLSLKHEVVAYDIQNEKVDQINKRKSPIIDTDIQDYFDKKELNLKATNNQASAIKDSEVYIICTPTNYMRSQVISILVQ